MVTDKTNKNIINISIKSKFFDTINNALGKLSIQHSVCSLLIQNKQVNDWVNSKTSKIYGISDSLTQRAWHAFYEIYEIPKDPITSHFMAFKSFKDGYISTREPTFKSNLKSLDRKFIIEAFTYPIMFKKVKKSDILINIIHSMTQFMPLNTSLYGRYTYVANGKTTIHKCIICEMPIINSNKNKFSSFKYCCKKCETISRNNTRFNNFEKIMNAYNDKKLRRLIVRILNDSIKLKKIIISKFLEIIQDKNIEGIKTSQMLYHIKYEIDKYSKCGHCDKTLKYSFNTPTQLYPITCSIKCNNKYRKNIEKRLRNNSTNSSGYMTNVGKHEEELIRYVEEHVDLTFQRNKLFSGGFFPDGINVENKIIVEVNEAYHLNYKQKLKDKLKYETYIDKGYKVLLCWDNIKTNIKFDNYIKKLMDIFGDNVSNIFFIDTATNNGLRILTPNGFEPFAGIKRNKNIGDIIQFELINGKKIASTPNHLFYDSNNMAKLAKDFETNDLIISDNGNLNITKITTIPAKEHEYVYDIVDSGYDSCFITNGIKSHNCIIIDECAFIAPNVMDNLWTAVYPTISSDTSGKSKCILVSTPNGIGNLFHEMYTAGLKRKKTEEKGIRWNTVRIDWFDVPGRDERWKQEQLESFNGDDRRFAQEFGNSFIGSSQSLISAKIIDEMIKNNKNIKYETITIYDNDIKIWKQPKPKAIYVLGIDVADGAGKDKSVIDIYDITRPGEIIDEVAHFSCNKISPTELAYLSVKLANMYNMGIVMIEYNGIGSTTCRFMNEIYDYYNIASVESKDFGILSNNTLKSQACRNLKKLFDNKGINLIVKNPDTLSELLTFERRSTKSGKYTYNAIGSSHYDDNVMALVWAMLILDQEYTEEFLIIESVKQIGLEFIPSVLTIDSNESETNGLYDKEIDSIFKSIKNKNITTILDEDDNENEYDYDEDDEYMYDEDDEFF